MTRYAAFLRGVTPMNLKMADLKAAFEAAGFQDVRTLLSCRHPAVVGGRAANGMPGDGGRA